jgi:hypothetical protein
MAQSDLVTELSAQETRGAFQQVHRLPGDMPIPDDRNEDLGVLQILGNLNPRNRRETQPRIFQLLRYERSENALHFVVDPLLALLVHAGVNSAATVSTA